jgi:hypothetical protein
MKITFLRLLKRVSPVTLSAPFHNPVAYVMRTCACIPLGRASNGSEGYCGEPGEPHKFIANSFATFPKFEEHRLILSNGKV